MKMLTRNTLQLSLTKFFSFLCLCISIVSNAQEFEWVYGLKDVDIDHDPGISFNDRAHISSVITKDEYIYMIGSQSGVHDFGDGQPNFVEGDVGLPSDFIIKMDQNKNVIWVKQWRNLNINGLRQIIKVGFDSLGNILFIGHMINYGTQVTLDPDFHPVLNPNITHPTLSTDIAYDFIIKLDENGNYINSRVFENLGFSDFTIDNNGDIVMAGYHTVRYNIITDPAYQYPQRNIKAFITKLDNNFNTVWEKTFEKLHEDAYAGFRAVGTDSQNNIYCIGTYRNGFVFDNLTFEDTEGEFLCKLYPNGDEVWIVGMENTTLLDVPLNGAPNNYRELEIDAADNLYFFSEYSHNIICHFNNITLTDLPEVDFMGFPTQEAVVFKTDSDGNHLWHAPIYGLGDQSVVNFCLNNLGQPLLVVKSQNDIHYSYDDVLLGDMQQKSFLLKLNAQGGLVDFKRLDFLPTRIHTDVDSNPLGVIILAKYID